MKVLHCIYDHPANPWVGGGGAVRLFEIYARLTGEVSVTLATGRFPGLGAGERKDSLEHRPLGISRPYALSRLTYAIQATRLLAEAAYDAAVFDFSAYSPVVIPGDRPVGVMLGQIAGPTAGRRWGRAAGALVRNWEQRQLGRARSVAAVSPWLLEEARPLLHPDADTRVIGAGVSDRFFSVRRDERDFILYYGRFDIFQKGIDVLLDAYALLARNRPAPPLYIAGRGRDGPRIASMARERGLSGVEVVSDPAPERVHELLAGAMVLVMPSRFEGFGMVAAEAMAAGVPLVATRVDALPDVVGPDGGVLVPAEDAAATAEAVAELIAAPERRAALTRTARARAARFSWNGVARDHLAWLHDIAGAVPPTS
jgi:glycogen synthase